MERPHYRERSALTRPRSLLFMAQLTRIIYEAPDGTGPEAGAPLRKLTNYLRSMRCFSACSGFITST
jgi:hypothetical protein